MFKSVSSEEAKKIISEKIGDAKFSILDVRTLGEFQSGAMSGAKNNDYYEPSFLAELNKLDKTGSYLIYCRSGSRSKGALQIMQQLGFSEVYELDDGFANFQ